MNLFARIDSKTGKGMNQGFVVNDGEHYFEEEKDLIEHLRGKEFIDAYGVIIENFSNEELKEWAYNEEIYYWTEWEDESEFEYKEENGILIEI